MSAVVAVKAFLMAFDHSRVHKHYYAVQIAAGVDCCEGIVAINDSLGCGRPSPEAGRVLQVLLPWLGHFRPEFALTGMGRVCFYTQMLSNCRVVLLLACRAQQSLLL